MNINIIILIGVYSCPSVVSLIIFSLSYVWLRGKKMGIDERRHHPRIKALNLISYNCIDAAGSVVAQGMGRTLNVSEEGILLETHVSIDPKYAIKLAIGLEDELINIKGSIIFSNPGKDEKFEAGIEFVETDDNTIEVLKKYIKVFSESE